MSRKIHVVFGNGKWLVKGEGENEAISEHRTKDAAIKKAAQVASQKNGQYVLHRRDGTIMHREAHRRDSLPPQDKKSSGPKGPRPPRKTN